jgi:hypothetical protein
MGFCGSDGYHYGLVHLVHSTDYSLAVRFYKRACSDQD